MNIKILDLFNKYNKGKTDDIQELIKFNRYLKKHNQLYVIGENKNE